MLMQPQTTINIMDVHKMEDIIQSVPTTILTTKEIQTIGTKAPINNNRQTIKKTTLQNAMMKMQDHQMHRPTMKSKKPSIIEMTDTKLELQVPLLLSAFNEDH